MLPNASKSCCTAKALRDPGQRAWPHTGGRNYCTPSEAFTYDAVGAWNGTARIRWSFKLGQDSDKFNASASLEVFDTNGTINRRFKTFSPYTRSCPSLLAEGI